VIEKCEIENILSTNFIFCGMEKDHHYLVSMAELLGPAQGMPVLPRSMFWELWLYNNHCHHQLFMKFCHVIFPHN
jgi:hypothetical protein